MKIIIDFLGINPKKQEKISKFHQETKLVSWGVKDSMSKDYVLFVNGQYAFILAHGSEDGGIQINGNLYTPQSVINWLSPIAKKQGINHVYTISCFGGKQDSVECDGVKMSSFHTSTKEVSAMELFDGFEFVFDVTEDELKRWTLIEQINSDKDFEVFIRE